MNEILEMVTELELTESYDDFDIYEGNGKRYEVDFDEDEVLAIHEIDEDNEIIETLWSI